MFLKNEKKITLTFWGFLVHSSEQRQSVQEVKHVKSVDLLRVFYTLGQHGSQSLTTGVQSLSDVLVGVYPPIPLGPALTHVTDPHPT